MNISQAEKLARPLIDKVLDLAEVSGASIAGARHRIEVKCSDGSAIVLLLIPPEDSAAESVERKPALGITLIIIAIVVLVLAAAPGIIEWLV